ncbi:hypothetical protein B0T11DRAFT_321026 [Plectosphaerella cucumerina]|uniref:2EXR domain-containing protein n=1 Tax=Plectosphaerella cucumerina TaxID=40658 RepID=A0A8K0T9B3_9PEZI|nr:hypothetical protein B0T11DRAFT_321026 [Plectosphaerella cucumerina]
MMKLFKTLTPAKKNPAPLKEGRPGTGRPHSEAPIFHHFTLLPFELRQHIWELSIEPRRVVVRPRGVTFETKEERMWYGGVDPCLPPLTMAPGSLHACTESRSYLLRYYTKAFLRDSAPFYIWVNFDIDTICVIDQGLVGFPEEMRLIKHLHLEIRTPEDEEPFDWTMGYHELRHMPLLEDLEIPTESGREWWAQGLEWMIDWYYHEHHDPVRFRARIVCDDPDDEVSEVNPDNYLKVGRDGMRKRWLEHPDFFSENPEFPDSDDDTQCQPRWRHVTGCGCSREDRWPPARP